MCAVNNYNRTSAHGIHNMHGCFAGACITVHILLAYGCIPTCMQVRTYTCTIYRACTVYTYMRARVYVSHTGADKYNESYYGACLLA